MRRTIVSKRKDKPYCSGLCKHWIKVKSGCAVEGEAGGNRTSE